MAYNTGASSGNLSLITESTGSGLSQLTITSGIDSTYTNYVLSFVDLSPDTVNAGIRLQYSSNGGSSYLATNYNNAWWNANNVGSGLVKSTTYILVVYSSTSSYPININANLYNLNNGSNVQYSCVGGFYRSDQSEPTAFNAIDTGTNNTINALRVYAGTGNISGTIRLFGVQK